MSLIGSLDVKRIILCVIMYRMLSSAPNPLRLASLLTNMACVDRTLALDTMADYVLLILAQVRKKSALFVMCIHTAMRRPKRATRSTRTLRSCVWSWKRWCGNSS
jgi:hypothetical protein